MHIYCKVETKVYIIYIRIVRRVHAVGDALSANDKLIFRRTREERGDGEERIRTNKQTNKHK